MSQNPQKRNKDSKEAAEGSIEQPTTNEDTAATTESVEVTGTGEGEATETPMAGSGL
jgi:hypothetical protein